MTIIELQAMKMIGIFMTETIDDNEPDDVLGRIENRRRSGGSTEIGKNLSQHKRGC